jgi:hypothetical protein
MEDLFPELSDPYLSRPARSLGEACRRAGQDRGGWRCAGCRLARLCQDESRWLVTRAVRDWPGKPRN